MSSETSTSAEPKAEIGLVESGCGGTDVAPSGANTKRRGSEPPTPEGLTPILPKPTKEEEEDDVLTYLVDLFGLTTLEDSEDSDDGERDSEDESAPSSPRSKGLEKYNFYVSDRVYYYDKSLNVFSEGGILVHDGSFNFLSNELFGANFWINNMPFWFDLYGGLWSNDVNDKPYRIITWQQEPSLLELCPLIDSPQNALIPFQPNSNSGLCYNAEPELRTTPAADGSKPKTEIFSPNVNPNSLQQTFQEGIKPVPWSPSSSAEKSPIVSTGSRESSEGPGLSLFPEAQSGPITSHPVIEKWQQDLVQVKQTANKARPVRKPSKEERRRCPVCNKLFRRPSSLEDHLNVHSGDKPHTCPFKGCNTGFATKSNMKRHFLTHRVGLLERYRPGVTEQLSETQQLVEAKSGKPPRPTSTYNSKSYHNGRFRIA